MGVRLTGGGQTSGVPRIVAEQVAARLNLDEVVSTPHLVG